MCEIIALSDISGLKKAQITSLTVKARDLMKNMSDGFGFAYSTKNRKTKVHDYYVEKYTAPDHYAGIGTVSFSKGVFNEFKDAVHIPMLSSGHPDSPTGPIIMHGRHATNDVNLANTHPFRKKGWALVHNGVVDCQWDDLPHGYYKDDGFDNEYIANICKRYSTCDSEFLLNTYVHGKGHHDWFDHLEGYAATMAISPKNDLIVAKDGTARLYMAGIPALNNTMVFSTKSTVAAELAKTLGYYATPAFKMRGCRAVTITPKGEVTIEKFADMDSVWTSSASSALGFGKEPVTYDGNYGHNKPITKGNSTLLKNSKTKVYNNETNQMELITHTTVNKKN
jgi:hypothetical protein